MATQLVCDSCGEVIDQNQPYWSVQGSKVQIADGVLTTVEAAQQFDYHDGHLPVEFQAQEAPVIDNTLPGDLPPDEEPQPVEEEDKDKPKSILGKIMGT